MRCPEFHRDDPTNTVQKLHMDYKPHRELSSSYRLTEKFPVAQTLSSLNIDVRSITLKVIFCPCCIRLIFITQGFGPPLFKA